MGDEGTLTLAERKVSFELAKMERLLDAVRRAGGETDFLWIGADLGTQIAPMISRDLFLRVFRPAMQRYMDLANAFDIPVMVHTCGSSSWAYEDFIEMGVRAVDTLQPEAANMSPEYLKERFAGRLALHGCISRTTRPSKTSSPCTTPPIASAYTAERRNHRSSARAFMRFSKTCDAAYSPVGHQNAAH